MTRESDFFPSPGGTAPTERVRVDFPKPGDYLLLNEDNSQELIHGAPAMKALAEKLGTDTLGTIRLHKPKDSGHFMIVDIEGGSKARRTNPIATSLYHMNAPGFGMQPVCGPVIIAWGGDLVQANPKE